MDKLEKVYSEGFFDGQNQAMENTFLLLDKIFESIESLHGRLDEMENKMPNITNLKIPSDVKMKLMNGSKNEIISRLEGYANRSFVKKLTGGDKIEV